MLTLLRTDSFWSYSLAYVRIVRIIRKRQGDSFSGKQNVEAEDQSISREDLKFTLENY